MLDRDRRKSVRVPVDFDLQVVINNKLYAGKALNLSVDGMCISTTKVLLSGDAVGLFFRLPQADAPLQTRAVVAWTRQIEHNGDWTFGMGVKFEGIEPSHQDGLQTFISELMSL